MWSPSETTAMRLPVRGLFRRFGTTATRSVNSMFEVCFVRPPHSNDLIFRVNPSTGWGAPESDGTLNES
jgi:hypothetical protein